MLNWIKLHPLGFVAVIVFSICVLISASTVLANDSPDPNDSDITILAEGRVISDETLSDAKKDLVKNHEVDLSKPPALIIEDDGGWGIIYWEKTKQNFKDVIDKVSTSLNDFIENNSAENPDDATSAPPETPIPVLTNQNEGNGEALPGDNS